MSHGGDRRGDAPADPMPAVVSALARLHEDAQRHHRAGRLDRAETLYRQVLRAEPGHARALHHLGLLRSQQGALEDAVRLMAMAIAARPDFAEAYGSLALVFGAMGRHDSALAACRRAAVLAPADAAVRAALATAQRNAGDLAGAAESLRAAIALDPANPDWHGNLGVALATLRRFEEAVAPLRQALAARPGMADWHRALGTVLSGLGRFEEAVAALRQAIAIRPDFAEAHYNLAQAFQRLERFEEAGLSFRRAIAIRPDYADAHGGLAALLLLTGELREGFAEFRWRWRAAGFPRMPDIACRPWEGEDLGGRTILVHCEQGFGDTLQFIRYAVPLRARAARVLVRSDPALAALLRSIPGIEVVTALPAGSVDFHVPLMCLPRLFGTTLDTIPADVPYLSADPARHAAWAARVAPYRGRRNVGLVWAGRGTAHSPDHEAMDRRRSLALRALAPLAGINGVRFFSLQTGAPSAQADDPPPGLDLIDLTAGLRDFADTAALAGQLDLVISVDTSVIHLAGALGRPAWLLNRFDTCWRWLRDREDSPWYPTLRQFRQPAPGDWSSVAGAVRDALLRLADGDDSQLRPYRADAGGTPNRDRAPPTR